MIALSEGSPRVDELRGESMRTPDEVAAMLWLKALGWLARYKSIRLSDADRVALMQVFAESAEKPLDDVAQALNDTDGTRTYAMLLRNWVLLEAGAGVRENPLIRPNPRLMDNATKPRALWPQWSESSRGSTTPLPTGSGRVDL